MRFAKEAWPFVLPFLAVAAVLFATDMPRWGLGALLAGLAVLLFFRDPQRRYEGQRDAVLAAADGLVTRVDSVEDPEVGPGSFHRIVTFLSIFDVHVQRFPVAGEVVLSRHTPGRKVAAFRADAADVNEQQLTVIRCADGHHVGVRQIAGLLARRVVCYGRTADRVERGQRLGLIKFGSRVDLLLPQRAFTVLVERGQRVRNGATAVAVFEHGS